MVVLSSRTLLCATLFAFGLFPSVEAQVTDLSANYSFRQLRIGGGGFVTGIVSHPLTPNLVYARTDTSGAFKWDETARRWSALIRADSVPSPAAGSSNEYGVEGLALAQSDDQVLYIAVGGDANGRILKSSD